MLCLRLDQAEALLSACRDLKERLAVRYFMFNGLSSMELSNARIEHLDPVSCELFLPKRHWKRNCVTTIDRETVRLQIMYSGNRVKGPLLRSRNHGGHIGCFGLWALIKRVAKRTNMPNRDRICPLVLKRTFGKLFLQTPGNTVAGLQKQFSHKHLWSTAHYLRFCLQDAQEEHNRMMQRVELGKVSLPFNDRPSYLWAPPRRKRRKK